MSHNISENPPSDQVTPLLKAVDLTCHYPVRQSGKLWGSKVHLKALDGVSFDVFPGEAFGIVGESGCGKSTAAKVILNMVPVTSGTVHFDGREILNGSTQEWRKLRQDMQLIFQDPLGSLDPRMKAIDQVIEPLSIHGIGTLQARKERATTLLEQVGVQAHLFEHIPYQLSGGQRQRVVIARALMLEPKLLICDEPVSALDVSIQAQVVNLLASLKERLGVTMIFISHDLSVVRYVCDRIAVMYLGRIVELAAGGVVFANPAHPYTEALLSAVPIPDPEVKRERIFLTGDPPSPINLPSGCRFHPRCPKTRGLCRQEEPELKSLGSGHLVACHFPVGEYAEDNI
jgi:peptide/nickel transport system ATP-binding protein